MERIVPEFFTDALLVVLFLYGTVRAVVSRGPNRSAWILFWLGATLIVLSDMVTDLGHGWASPGDNIGRIVVAAALFLTDPAHWNVRLETRSDRHLIRFLGGGLAVIGTVLLLVAVWAGLAAGTAGEWIGILSMGLMGGALARLGYRMTRTPLDEASAPS